MKEMKKNFNESNISEYYSNNCSNKIKICFLFHSHAFWPSWESFWNACLKDPKIEATMIFCPVQSQKPGYTNQFKDSEKFLQRNGISYININCFDFIKNKPDFIVIQTPYEGHRDRKWHSEMFSRRGIKVIYISYGLEFVETPLAIINHFRLPIYKCATRIFTFSEFMKDDYSKFGYIDTNVVKSIGHPKFDALFTANRNNLPEKLIQKIHGRKCILWHTHFPCKYSEEHGEFTLSTFSWDKDIELLNYILKQKDLFFIFMPHHLFFEAFEKIFNISKDKIDDFRNRINNAENMILWEQDYPDILACCDAVIGERSAVTMESLVLKKPVCYLEQAPEVYNTFGKDALDSFYYADNVHSVFDFINNIKNNKDLKYIKREEIFNKYFKKYFDGNNGERIKNEIISTFIENKKNIGEKSIPIFMIASDDIIMPATVAIASIVYNTKRHIDFYILQNSNNKITEFSKNNIIKIQNITKNFSIEYITVDNTIFDKFTPSTAGYIKNDTYFRYIIPNVNKDIDKAIYLDVDIICNGDISELYDFELNSYMLAAARKDKINMTEYAKSVIKKTGIQRLENYFNAGVLLINCKAWRKYGMVEKLFKTTQDLIKKIDWADQDVLNIVFEHSNIELPEKFNTYPRDKKEGLIIHYVGADKPWITDPKFYEKFWDYAKKTVYYKKLYAEFKWTLLREKINTTNKLLNKICNTKNSNNKDLWNIYDSLYKTIDNMNKSMWNIYDDLNYKISKNKYCEQYSLFGTIPLLKCVYNNNIKKYYLFNFIHIFTKKIKF